MVLIFAICSCVAILADCCVIHQFWWDAPGPHPFLLQSFHHRSIHRGVTPIPAPQQNPPPSQSPMKTAPPSTHPSMPRPSKTLRMMVMIPTKWARDIPTLGSSRTQILKELSPLDICGDLIALFIGSRKFQKTYSMNRKIQFFYKALTIDKSKILGNPPPPGE